MMLGVYNSIDRMNLEKVDENASNKKYSFVSLISVLIIGNIIGVIIGRSLQANSNNNAHVNLKEQLEQQPSNLDLDSVNTEKYANSHDLIDFSSNIDISSLASPDSSWDVRAKLTDLSDGSIVTIRGVKYGGFLQNPQSYEVIGSSNKVESELRYESNRQLWTVGKDSSNGYTFKNNDANCYLQERDGYLKCLSTIGDIYWIANSFGFYSGDSSDYRRAFTILKNKNNNKCPKVGSATDSEIGMSTNNCNYVNAAFQFEIVKS